MLGWLITLVTSVITFFNSIFALLNNIPSVLASLVEMWDFAIDTATVFFGNFPVPILVIAFIFLNIVVFKIIIEVI